MASAAAARHVHIEGLQTALPTRKVETGRARPVTVSSPPLPAAALQLRARVVLYYRAAAGAGAGAAWGQEEALLAKESLSEAVADHPEMAGRLRRRADGSSWEVKLNDTGVRLVLATAEATVDDFVGAGAGAAGDREAALAPWTDVDAEDPDMCALCFVQLTRFQGDGGYAVGVSCSLMLCDPPSLARFLLSWARTHAEIRARNKAAPIPMMQYAGYFQRPDTMTRRIKSVPLDSLASAGAGAATETLLFRASGGAPGGDHRALARACVDEASERLGKGKVPRFSLLAVARDGVGGNPRGMTVETCAAEDGLPVVVSEGSGYELEVAQWQDLGLEEFALRESKPVHVSYSIVTGGGDDEALVVVVPDGKGFLITATVPK
ncbi:unnamed protein product [Urochloa decumbens]|uniref:Uncharacterized protein n=1 Tax=Urochloa decumbens TaxID=240449 RepID=A0ABC8V9P7_9POAL